jgi:hypothetical protein
MCYKYSIPPVVRPLQCKYDLIRWVASLEENNLVLQSSIPMPLSVLSSHLYVKVTFSCNVIVNLI